MKTFLVTGATAGIGLETAAQLATLGHRVLLHGRSERSSREAASVLAQRRPAVPTHPVWGDLSSLAAVAQLARQVHAQTAALDGLINNAGVFVKARTLSADGFELTLAVNHLAHALLTQLLQPLLAAAPAARVVNLSSIAHQSGRLDMDDMNLARGYDGYRAYARSKLANVLYTHELARRLAATPITANAVHPGVITTRLLREGFGRGGDDVETGAKTSVYVALEPSLAGVSGKYFANAQETPCAAHALNPPLEKAFYDWTLRAVAPFSNVA